MKKPWYIEAAKIAIPNIRYEWDDWQWRKYCGQEDDAFYDSYTGLERSALIGLTIAEAEWLVFRYEGLSSDTLPLEYLEAAWCANVDRLYSTLVELRDVEWRGPVRKPLQICVTLIDEALYLVEDWDDPLWHPSMMSGLIEHILPDPEPFRRWRDRCVERLQLFYREAEESYENLFEEPPPILVPREVFDPEFDFKPENAHNLIDNFLRSVDYRTNRFLADPSLMVREGFTGTPYTLSV